MTWESDLVASLSSLPSTEKMQKLLNELEVVTGKRHLFIMKIFEKIINEMPLMSAVKYLAMTIRELDNPDLLARISKSLLQSSELCAASPSSHVHPLIYLVNACPQILPYILSDLVRAINKNSSLMKPSLPFLAFVVSLGWTSPLSDNREIVEALVTMRESCGPVELAALLSECIKRLELDGYSPVNTVNLAISKIALCLDVKSSEPTFMLLLDSLILSCKKNEENILPFLLDIVENVPESLKPFYSCLLCVFLMHESGSMVLVDEILFEAGRLDPENYWIVLSKFYLGLSKDIMTMGTSKVYSPTDLVQYFESDELKILTKYLQLGSIPFVHDNSFSSTLSLFHATQSMFNGTQDLSLFFSDLIPLSAYHEEIKMLLVHCFKKRPGNFDTLLRTVIQFGATSESNRTFALELISSFLHLPKLRLAVLPVLCDELKDHAYLFNSIQAALPILLTSTSPSAQLLFSVCVRSIVKADSRQGHLNFAFACVKEFFKAKGQCVEAVGLMLEVLDALCAIRYVDPKVVWNNIVRVHALHLIEKHDFIRALCCPLASKAIMSHKLALDEPVSEEVTAFFKYLTDSLFCTKLELVIEAASGALLQLDPLLFPDTFPTAHTLAEFMKRFSFDLQEDSQFVMLLKRLLDNEISDMPRSLFLGTSTRASTKTESDADDELIQKLRDKTASEWQSSPYMLEPYLRLELITLSPEISAESAESILINLLRLPSLMQIHWRTRVSILEHLTKLVTELLVHLNAHGHLGAIADRFKDRCDALIKTGSSPAQVACGLLFRTSLELALSEVHKDSRVVSWAKELKEPHGKYGQSEEVEAAVLLCLWKICKVHPVLDAAMLKTGTPWLSIVSAMISNDAGLPLSSDDPLISALSSSTCDFGIESLKSLTKKPKLAPSEVQQAQVLILGASKLENPTEEILETAMALHPALLVSEPAELKNLTSIYISRICHRLPEDLSEVWLKHLIGKLEKPAPAIVKSDAAIALTELLFGSSSRLIDRVPPSFFSKIVPALISSSTDSRVCSWYIDLLACKNSQGTGSSSPMLKVAENRFDKDWAFGHILASLGTTKTLIKFNNQLKILTRLKTLPRIDWEQFLERFVGDTTADFITAHVVTKLSTGGTFISPSLLKFLKQDVSSIPIGKLDDVLPFVERPDHEFIVKKLLETMPYGQSLLPTFELFSKVYAGLLEKPSFFDQMAIALLSDPSKVQDQEVYQLASTIIDDQPSVVCTFLRLVKLKQHWDMKQLVAIIRDPSLYQYGFLEMVTNELSELPDNLRTGLFVKILELALIEPDLELAMHELFTGLVRFWLDPVHRALLQNEAIGVTWRAYEAMNVDFEDWRRLGKRFAQLGPRWDAFKRQPSLISHVLNL